MKDAFFMFCVSKLFTVQIAISVFSFALKTFQTVGPATMHSDTEGRALQ